MVAFLGSQILAVMMSAGSGTLLGILTEGFAAIHQDFNGRFKVLARAQAKGFFKGMSARFRAIL